MQPAYVLECVPIHSKGLTIMPIIVDKKKKREEIMQAAVAVFARTGYHRAKIKDIADEAGVGKGTVYEYFRSKEDLFLEMCEYMFGQYVLNQKQALDAIPDSEQQIRTLISSSIEQAAMWTGMIYLYIDMWAEMDRKNEEDELRRIMARILKYMTDMLSEYIREGQARGSFKDFNPDLVAHIVLAALDGLMFQLLINKNMFDLEAMGDTLAGVLLEGLRKQETE